MEKKYNILYINDRLRNRLLTFNPAFSFAYQK